MGPPNEVRPSLSATQRTSPAAPVDGEPVDADPADAGPTESLATMGCLWSQNPDGSRFMTLRAPRAPIERLGRELPAQSTSRNSRCALDVAQIERRAMTADHSEPIAQHQRPNRPQRNEATPQIGLEIVRRPHHRMQVMHFPRLTRIQYKKSNTHGRHDIDEDI